MVVQHFSVEFKHVCASHEARAFERTANCAAPYRPVTCEALGHLLRRDENYYGDAGGPPEGIDPDAPMADDLPAPHHSSEGDA